MAKKVIVKDSPGRNFSIDTESLVAPITILSTDWHLKKSNIEQIKNLVREKCELAKKLKIKIVFCLGDIFELRAGQKVEELCSLDEILDIFEEYDITLWCIPGNHDKQSYTGFKSFLQPYRHHPNFKYIDKAGGVPMGDIQFHLLPYFKENFWLERYKELCDHIGNFKDGKKHILLSHIALNGSVNNDGSKVECGISVGDFKQWFLVLLGHYHDEQEVGKNVFHIPSIQQNNFGENIRKGFTIVYSDGSFDLHKSTFKEYEKVSINFDKITKKEFDILTKQHVDSNKFIRFEIIGSADKVKAINKEELSVLGIDVKVKVKEIEDTIEYADEEVKEYTKESIVEEFKSFCKEKEKDLKQGMIYLTKKLEHV